jgi:hypothetical protein
MLMVFGEGPFKYRELLERGPVDNFRRICLAIAINVMQQFTGANMIKCVTVGCGLSFSDQDAATSHP